MLKRVKVAAIVIAVLASLLIPASAFAETLTATKVVSEFPNVGDTVELGYGDVTSLWCTGETFEEGQVWFNVHFDDTWDVFGNALDATNFMCIDHDLGALGGGYGDQGWPVQWVGSPTRFKATATVTNVDPAAGTVTYTVLAYAVRYVNGVENTNPAYTGFQRMQGTITVYFPTVGSLSLLKVSSAPDCTEGNPMYSLEGAEYGLYASEEDANADDNRIFTFVTNAEGRTQSTDMLATGTYWVKELKASQGYRVDQIPRMVSLTAGANSFTVQEIPFSDPPVVWKTDSQLEFDPQAFFKASQNKSQGAATLAGAQFEVRYYAGLFSVEECAAITPTRTWIIQSDNDGYAEVRASYVVAGDPVYIGANGDSTMPLGTVTIREIAAPAGYKMPADPPTILVHITPSGPVYSTGHTAAFFADDVIKGRIAVTKTLVDANGNEADPARLAGVQVRVVATTSGATVATLTLDETGSATSGLLPYDTYQLYEVPESLPADVQPYSWTTALTNDALPFASVSITAEITYTATFTDYTTETVTVTKTDIDSGVPLSGAVFDLYSVPTEFLTITDGAVSVSGDFDASNTDNWIHVETLTTDEYGVVRFNRLPFGVYRVIETEAPAHYMTETRTQNADETIVHDLVIDALHESAALSIADKRVDIAVEIYEKTIEVTSAAFDGTEYGLASNVGEEEYIYHVGTANDSSVDTDRFILTTPMNDINDHGLRVTRVWTGTATGDYDGTAILRYQTALSEGWLDWVEVDLSESAQHDVEDLGLAEGDYITALQADFGPVASDFHSGTEYGDDHDWCFAVVATEALTPDVPPITNSSTAYTALDVSPTTTIDCEAVAEVETRVIEPFTMEASGKEPVIVTETTPVVIPGGSLPVTGDANAEKLAKLGAVAVGSSIVALIAGAVLAVGAWCGRNGRRSTKRHGHGMWALLLLPTLGIAIALAAPLGAMAEEGADGQHIPAVRTTVRTITFMEGDEPAIPETIEEDGVTWTLAEVADPEPVATFDPEISEYDVTETGTFATLEAARAAYPETREVEQEGFAGTATLTDFSYTQTRAWETTVADRTMTFGPYGANDVAYLPDAMEITVMDDAGSHTETIRRADVRWEAAQADSAGMPTGYVATVTFRGSVTLTHTTGYQVTARYQGTLTSTARQMTVTATYQAPVEDAGLGADAASGTALLEPEAEAAALAQGGVNLSAGAIAGTATAAVAAAFAAFVFFRTRNVRICTRAEEKTIAKAHARRAVKGLELTLPARISLKDGVILYLRQNLCDGGPLTVAQAGVTVFEGLAEQRIVLDPPASVVKNS